MNSKLLILIPAVWLLVFGVFFGNNINKTTITIESVKQAQQNKNTLDHEILKTDEAPHPLIKVYKDKNANKTVEKKVVKKYTNEISKNQNPFRDPNDNRIKYHAVVDSEKDIDKLQNPFSDPSDKKLTDIEILRKELKALKKRTGSRNNSMVEYTLNKIPEAAKKHASDLFGFFGDTVSDITNTIPGHNSNEEPEIPYNGY